MSALEPTDGCDATSGRRHVVEGAELPARDPSCLVKLIVGLLIVNADGGTVGIGGRGDRGTREAGRQGSTGRPAMAPDNLVNDVVLLLVVNADLRFVGPPNGGETGDGRDVGCGERRALAPATAVDVFLDSTLIIEVIYSDLGRTSAGIPDNGGKGRAESSLEQLLGAMPATADIVVESGLIDETVGVLMVHAKMKTYQGNLSVDIHAYRDSLTIILPLDGSEASAFDVRHGDSANRLREMRLKRLGTWSSK